MFKMSEAVDLHVHTSFSDGLLTPAKTVELADSLLLAAVAITDHDTVEGIEGALRAAVQLSVEVVPGVELSTEYDNREVHILGYYIDHTHPGLCVLLEKLRRSRHERAQKIVDKLRHLGFVVDYQEVMRLAGEAAPGRVHIARALVNNGHVESVRNAFEQLIGYRRPAYVERLKLSPGDAISAIRAAGGVAVWAHPGLTGNDRLLEKFLSWGLKGLEVYHPDHGCLQAARYRKMADRKNLCITGGSDFHGSDASRARGLGSCGVTVKELLELKKLEGAN